jgi:hypothetical protein
MNLLPGAFARERRTRMNVLNDLDVTAEIIDFEIDGDILVVSFWLIVNGAKQDIWEITLVVEE